MALKLTRNKQFGIKLESTNGTAETLSASDYGLELTELTATPGVEMIENDVFKNSISASTARVGKKTATATIGGEFKNSGTLNTEPRISEILQIARMKKSTVKGMAVSNVVGSIVRGVTVLTGGTSAASGIAIALEGGNRLYVLVNSGTFQNAETITGSGFSCTAGAQDAGNTGFVYFPKSDSTSEKCATININDGGFEENIYGAVATFGLELTTDSYAKWASTLIGVCDTANWGSSASEVTGITYESEVQAVVNNATLKINGTVAPLTSSVNIDLGNSTMVIKDLNSSTWLKYGVVTDRDASGTINVHAIDPNDYDLYAAFFAGNTATLEFQIGGGAGKQIDVILPAIQYQGVEFGDDSGFLTQAINFKATGTDNEVVIWFR
jgi:hypothetical protein